jgi:hypothetical protein
MQWLMKDYWNSVVYSKLRSCWDKGRPWESWNDYVGSYQAWRLNYEVKEGKEDIFAGIELARVYHHSDVNDM